MRRILSPSDTKRAVAVCLAFAVALGFLFLISSGPDFTVQVPKPSRAGTDVNERLGEIRFAPSKDGSCRSVKFDNRSGQLGKEKMIDCNADPTGHDRLGPFESIRKSFSGR
jgi:hypothetical protein